MKKQLLTSALLSLLCNILFAQAPSIEWQKCLGGSSDEAGFAVRQTIDGGYITAGFSQSNDGDVSGNHGQQDYWVVRTDPGADITWQKSLGGNSIDQATSLDETTDGGFVVAGYSYSNNGDVTGNHGSSDVWVIKLDDAGTLLWQKALGGTSDDGANSIVQTTDNGYIVAGYSSSNDGDVSGNHGQWDYWVVKLDATGSLVWQKSLGGSNNDVAYAVKQSSDGGYIVTGYSESSDGDVSGNSGARDFWLVKLNEIGDLEWENYFGGSAYDESYAVAETAAGDFVASGFAGSNDGDRSGNHGAYDFWIVKIDAIGNMVAQACFGGTSNDQSFSMDQTADDGFIVGGQSFSNDGDVSGHHGGYDFWVVKLDAVFNLEWQKSLGGTGDEYGPYSAQQTAEGGYVVTGSSLSIDGDVSDNHGGPVYGDCWEVKLVGGKATGIEDFNTVLFSVFPNPVADQLYLEGVAITDKTSLHIYDLQGRLLTLKLSQDEAPAVINVKNLISGTYLLEIKDEETGQVQRQKFVKQ